MFTQPNPEKIVTNTSSFFTRQPSTDQSTELYLTEIILSEEIIINAIHELSECLPVQQHDWMAVDRFKSQLDDYLRSIAFLPYEHGWWRSYVHLDTR